MSSPPGAGFPRAAFLAALGAVLLGYATPVLPQVAQSLEALVNQRRLEFNNAVTQYDAAVTAFGVVDAQWQDALDQVTRARRTGDDGALERAWAEAQDRAGPFAAQEQRVASLRDSVTVARQALMDAIESRLDELLDRMEAASTLAERVGLNQLFTDLRNELQGLDAASREGLTLQPVVLPDIAYDPRDDPSDRATKAQLLERQAGFLQAQIDDADARIRTLNNRLRIRRQSGDLLAGVERFDDTRVPVVGAVPTRTEVPADSTGAGTRPLTLEEQITELETYRAALESRRQQVLIKAEQFRGRGGPITW